MKMGKKGRVRGKKGAKRKTSTNEVTLERLEATKLKREETIATVKSRLEEKSERRIGNSARKEDEKLFANESSKWPLEKIMTEIRGEMKSVMVAGVRKVDAGEILRDRVKYDAKSSSMTISGMKYKIRKNVHAVGWGREALMLISALERIIGDNMRKGLVLVPRGTISEMFSYPELFPKLDTRIRITETRSDQPPDDVSVRATRNIADYCKKLKKKDILVVTLTRGSDHLLCIPRGTIELGEKMLLLEQLEEAGATKREASFVRTSLSAIRGGRLARLAHPAKVLCLVMSDLGPEETNLRDICGGPTFLTDDRASLSMARKVLEKYHLRVNEQSQGIRNILTDNGESLGSSVVSSLEKSVDNIVVASSKDSIDEMALAAFARGYVPIKINGITRKPASLKDLSKNFRRTSKDYARLVSLVILLVEDKITRTEMYDDVRENIVSLDLTENTLLSLPGKENWARGLYFLVCPSSDSRFVSTTRSERVANNQQLAIYFSLDWYLRLVQYPILARYVVWFLGGASNGRDGDTRYSGAYAYANLAVDVYRKFKMPGLCESLGRDGAAVAAAAAADADDNNDDDGNDGNDDDERDEDSWKEKRKIHESILPHKIMAAKEANLFFCNVNDGAELLRLGDDANRCTRTRVGDLHVIRIVRAPCCCCCCCASNPFSSKQ